MNFPLYKTPLIVTVRNFFGNNLLQRYSFGMILDTLPAKEVLTTTLSFISTRYL